MASFDHDTSRDTVYTNTSHDAAHANTLRDSAPTNISHDSAPTDTSCGSTPTDASEESPSLLKDLSMAQVLASSLAAVTAFALRLRLALQDPSLALPSVRRHPALPLRYTRTS